MFEATKKFCDSLLSLGLPGFDLVVFHKGACVLRYRNGYRDLENKLEMTGTERFNLYSCSKVITCTAALQLWEKGLFDLEDPLGDYIPQFREMTVQTPQGLQKAQNPIRIRHLFEMTAGFSYDVASPQLLKCREATGGACPAQEIVKYLAREPLLFEPGENWRYSLCHDVLAALVEVISGEKFEDYVRKNIFDVLGMAHSTFLLPEDALDTVAPQYGFENGKTVNIGKRTLTYRLGTKHASGGAGCISTVDDYIKFLEGLRTYVLLKKETVGLMSTDRLTPTQREKYLKKDTHGYGLGVRCSKGDPRYPDFGWDGAACSYLAIDTENEISIFFGAHHRASPAQEVNHLIYRFVRADLDGSESFASLWEELKTRYPQLEV